MQEQQALFHEDLLAALGHTISALGGNKKVGAALWPSLSPDAAGRKVAACLNSDHAQHFHPCDIVWLLREARKIGSHSAMSYLTQECGYATPQPMDPEDEAAELQRQFIQSVKNQERIVKQLERLTNLPRSFRGVG